MSRAPASLPVPLPPVWFHLLLALTSGERHGYALMKDVGVESGGQIRLGPGTLYGALKRLLELELVEQSARRPAPDLDDERRRYYRLTPAGRRVLGAEASRHAHLVELARARRVIRPRWPGPPPVLSQELPILLRSGSAPPVLRRLARRRKRPRCSLRAARVGARPAARRRHPAHHNPQGPRG